MPRDNSRKRATGGSLISSSWSIVHRFAAESGGASSVIEAILAS
jgi:hypothetical protein